MPLNHSPNVVCNVSFLSFVLPLLGQILSLPWGLFWYRSIVLCMRLLYVYYVIIIVCGCWRWLKSRYTSEKMLWQIWESFITYPAIMWSHRKCLQCTHQIFQIYTMNPFDTYDDRVTHFVYVSMNAHQRRSCMITNEDIIFEQLASASTPHIIWSLTRYLCI